MDTKYRLSQEELMKKIDGFFTEAAENIEPEAYKTIDKGVFLPPDQAFYRVRKDKK